MGIRQSIFGRLRSEEEDEQQQMHPFLDNVNNRKSYNRASFGSSSSSFYTIFKNLLLRIFKLLPFAKSRKPEPILPAVKPTCTPTFLQIQSTSSSYSDSSSSPNTIYATGLGLALQLQSDHYSSSKDVVCSTTTAWLQKPPVSSSVGCGSNGDEGLHYIKQMDMLIDVPSFDYESLACTNASSMLSGYNEDEGSCHIKQMGVIIDVPSMDYQSLACTNTFDVVDSTVSSIKNEENEVEEVEEEKVINHCVREKPKGRRSGKRNKVKGKAGKLINEESNEDEGSCHIKQMDVIIDVPSVDYQSLANTHTSAMERGSNKDEGSCHIKQMAVIIDVSSVDYQSLACTNTFDVDNSTVFSIKNEENEVEEVEEERVINHCVREKPKGRRRGKRNNVKGKEGKLVNEGKWITHYNSNHWILLVGEGDFSFSASLAVAFGYAPNMVATSLDSEEFLMKNYRRATSNIEELRRRGCTVMHGIDGTKIASPDLFGGMTFDQIIFNFPFAGFFKDLTRKAQLRKHQTLVTLFLKNAKELIGENGEIHISHKINDFHKDWKLESLASKHGLKLVEAMDFNRDDYNGYNTKCGFGGDNDFNCHPSKTYKFGLKRSSSSAC